MAATGRGGKRAGAGRKATRPAGLAVQKSVALEVLSRLSELGIKEVRTEADYALYLMKTDKRYSGAMFMDMLNRAHGKPAQAVVAEGKLTLEVVEMASADSSATKADAATTVM